MRAPTTGSGLSSASEIRRMHKTSQRVSAENSLSQRLMIRLSREQDAVLDSSARELSYWRTRRGVVRRITWRTGTWRVVCIVSLSQLASRSLAMHHCNRSLKLLSRRGWACRLIAGWGRTASSNKCRTSIPGPARWIRCAGRRPTKGIPGGISVCDRSAI